MVDDLTCLRENADIHPAGMQVDPAVILTRLSVESHRRPPGFEVSAPQSLLVGLDRGPPYQFHADAADICSK